MTIILKEASTLAFQAIRLKDVRSEEEKCGEIRYHHQSLIAFPILPMIRSDRILHHIKRNQTKTI